MKACLGLIETILVSQSSAQGTTHSQSQTKTTQGRINRDDQKQGKENAYAPCDEECRGIHKRLGIERLHVGWRKKRYALHTKEDSHWTFAGFDQPTGHCHHRRKRDDEQRIITDIWENQEVIDRARDDYGRCHQECRSSHCKRIVQNRSEGV